MNREGQGNTSTLVGATVNINVKIIAIGKVHSQCHILQTDRAVGDILYVDKLTSQAGQGFRWDADAIILNCDKTGIGTASCLNKNVIADIQAGRTAVKDCILDQRLQN